jgi:hypothetical protein
VSYDSASLAKLIADRLRRDVRQTLLGLSREFRVDRHTIDRALVRHFGVAFRELKAKCREDRFRQA